MINTILIKPIVTEKSQDLANKGKYVFIVNKKANKVEIGKAIERYYNVTVTDVNTSIVPSKAVTRSGRSGVMRGAKSAYKKAIVTLEEGNSIDIFLNPNEE